MVNNPLREFTPQLARAMTPDTRRDSARLSGKQQDCASTLVQCEDSELLCSMSTSSKSLQTLSCRVSPSRFSSSFGNSLSHIHRTRSNASPTCGSREDACYSPVSQALKRSCDSSDSEKKFKILNTETGEEIDLRDENKTDFVDQLNRVLQSKSHTMEHF